MITANDVDNCSISTNSDSVISNIYDQSTLCGSSQSNGSAYEKDTLELSVNNTSYFDISTDVCASHSNNNTKNSGSFLHLPLLNCASLNVCGLKRRLHYPDFCELVHKYDIFCVCETKLDKYDSIELHGFTFISQCRKQKFIRKSGGLGVFVRNELSEFITQEDSESDYIMWLKINKTAFKTNEDLYIGVVYVPPSDSRFNTIDETNIFNVEVANMCIDNKYVFLMGDFNARVCNKDDFVDADDFLTHHLSLDDTMDGSLNISSKLEKTNLSKHRVSQDKIINNEGNMLLDMCKSNSMLILNGRCGDDKFTGSMTFRNQSVIDYSIVSFQSLQFIKAFRVLELDALFSDGHSLISTSLCFKNDLKVKKSVPINTKAQKPRLPEEKRTKFIENLNRIKIQSLLANITTNEPNH